MGFGCVYVAVERTWALGKAAVSPALTAAAATMAEVAQAALEVAKKEEYKDAYLERLLVSALPSSPLVGTSTVSRQPSAR